MHFPRKAKRVHKNSSPARPAMGFALVACLLILLLLSAMSVALLTMVNTETKVGANDLNNSVAYHAAEGALEKMTADLSGVFSVIQAPNCADITNAIQVGRPANTGLLTYTEYQPTLTCDANGILRNNNCGPNGNSACWGTIQSGPNAGLNAQIVPVTLAATAQVGPGNQVRMVRTAEVALIPVFQFGVFSSNDLGFFNSPNLDFAGRVHTNGDLYLGVASGYTLTFHQKMTAYGNVIRQTLPNGLASNSASWPNTGTVKIPSASGACDSPQTTGCKSMSPVNPGSPFGDASVVGGPTSAQSGSWTTTVKTKYNGWLLDGNYGRTGGTGANCLSLPFATGAQTCPTGPGQVPSVSGAQPYEIIRRPPPGGDPVGSALSAARLYNEAEIRVLLADDPAELPGGAGDPQNIRLANVQTFAGAPDYSNGVPTSFASNMQALAGGKSYVTYFAEASTNVQDPSVWGTGTSPWNQKCLPADWSTIPTTYGPSDTVGRFTLLNYKTLPLPDTTVGGLSTSPIYAAPTTPMYAPLASADPACTTFACLAPPATDCKPATTTYSYYGFATAAQQLKLAPYPPLPVPSLPPAAPTKWSLIDGYLRVEYRDSNGGVHPVTQEWLELGFAREVNPPTSPGSNPVNPNAILIFQQPADRDGSGTISTADNDLTVGTQKVSGTMKGIPKPPEVALDSAALNTSSKASYYYGVRDNVLNTSTLLTQNNWYPINFYDPREGEARDNVTTPPAGSCAVNGVMNAVELDVGNLKRWLAGTTGASGASVDYATNNGYILYFSDRRGMLSNPTAGYKTGDAGLEDTINLGSGTASTADGALESPGGNASPEDVNLNGVLDNYGAKNQGLGLGVNSSINPGSASPNPYARISNCLAIARKNWVSGARRVLRLVDGGLGNVPEQPSGTGGFTVASENPVYVLGDYNANSTEQSVWFTETTPPAGEAASGIIADSVTVLSNAWATGGDIKSFTYPFGNPSWGGMISSSRRPNAATTYYRVAIAAGKNRAFPSPSWSQTSLLYGFGTDGGVHNFLRFIENWQVTGVSLYYKGSLVSLYYSTYGTGTFKCCGDAVYHPPARNYVFDALFSQPQNLPPGTPMFRDVDNLSYRQDLTPR